MILTYSLNEIIKHVESENYLHISFDYWNTIVESNIDFKIKRAELIRSKFKSPPNIQSITETFSSIGKAYNDKIEAGHELCTPIDLLRQVLMTLDNGASINVQEVYADCLTIFNEFSPIFKDPLIKDILQYLRNNKKRISITSNTAFIPGSSLRLNLKKTGLTDFFDFMLFSDEINCAKPSYAIYSLVYRNAISFSKNHITRKSQVLHVGDNIKSDYHGALEFGLKAILIK